MKFTLSWLKDHLETDCTLDEVVEKLTVIGLEVEDVQNPAERLKDFVVAEVISATKHPNADKLKVCEVNMGSETVQVVCGAPNAKTGMKGVFAPVGTYVPGIDLKLAKANIRGVESSGMLCSERELGLSDEHEGIIELPEDCEVGQTYTHAMGLDDPVIEIAITPNRPDCLGVRGIARDLAAAGIGELKADKVRSVSGKGDCPIKIDLKFTKNTVDACPVFAGRYIKGLNNSASPEWMQRRLRAIGLRPINALVDVTNYVSYDRGRPLHVYDADKLKGTVHARLGKSGETFLALDGKEYEVDGEMCVIADDNGVLGLGGVIGGEETGTTLSTVNVLIESAYFDPVRTAMTGRKLGIISDARYRFERGVDPHSVDLGIDMATELIVNICGGEPSKVQKAGNVSQRDVVIKFDTDEVKRLTGVHLKDSEIKGTLKKLGFKIEGKGEKVKIFVPSWRPDVSQPADLVEEVIRLVGVDRVPPQPMTRLTGVSKPVLTMTQKQVRRARRLLASRGLVESMTYGFIAREHAKFFGGGQDVLEIANPISSEMSSMRPSVLPGLLIAAQRNSDRAYGDSALFEVSQVYKGVRPDDQMMVAGGIRTGTAKLTGQGRHWDGTASNVDLFDVKADAVAVLSALGFDSSRVQITQGGPQWYHPGRSGAITLGPKNVLGHFGEFHPRTLEALDVSGPAAGFEIFLDNIPQPKRKTLSKPALDATDLQPVRRDFAFILDDTVPASDVIRAAQGADRTLITKVVVFDLFEGDVLGEGKKSLAVEVTLQPHEKTLTDEEIEGVADSVVAAVKKATGGEIRG